MVEHAPPPLEPKATPPPEIAPGTPNPEVLRVDHHSPASHQVHEFIALQGRTGNSGLSWEQHNHDDNVTTRYVTRTGLERQQLTDPKTGEPAADIEKHGLPFRRHRARTLDVFFRERVAVPRTAQVPVTYIEAYENDELVGIQKKTNAEFDEFLNRNGEEIGRFWLQPEQKTEAPDMDIAIDVTSAAKRGDSIVELVQEAQEENGLPDWGGFTYHDGRSGENVTILKDVMMRQRTMEAWTNERCFIKQIWSADGRPLRQEIEKADVTKAVLEKLPRGELNPRFRVVEADMQRREYARDMGEMALSHRGAMAPETKRERELQPEAAMELLAGVDFYEGEALERQKKKLREFKLTPEEEAGARYAAYAEALSHMAGEMGTANLLDLATRMKDGYQRAAKQIGFKNKHIGLADAEEDDTLSWILWDMAEQHYYSQHPAQAKGRREGLADGTIIGYYSENRDKQQELIDARIGKVLESVALVRMATGKNKKALLPREDGRGYEEVILGPEIHVEPNDDLLQDLAISPEAKGRLEEVLERATSKNPDLSYRDHAEIGALLREASTR